MQKILISSNTLLKNDSNTEQVLERAFFLLHFISSLLNFAPCRPRCFLELFAVPFFRIKYSFSNFFSQI